MELREISIEADKPLAEIIRYNLRKNHLDIPGTVYFDPELDHLSEFYLAAPDRRKYFILWDNDKVCGGVGFAEFGGFEKCAEIQKLYLSDEKKGMGLGKMLLQYAENEARKLGYTTVYIETHTNLDVALKLYYKYGYQQIDRPSSVSHGTMNRFLIKKI